MKETILRVLLIIASWYLCSWLGMIITSEPPNWWRVPTLFVLLGFGGFITGYNIVKIRDK